MRAINLLVINVHSCRNAGDAALLQVTIEQLKERLPLKSVVISLDDWAVNCDASVKSVCSPSGWVKPAGKWNFLRLFLLLPATLLPILFFRLFGQPIFGLTPRPLRLLIEEYLKADIVISKPGGFLYSSGHGLAFVTAMYGMLLSILAGKPLYVFPQSFGPLRHRWERFMLKNLMSKARIVMVREPISWQEAVECGVSPHRCKLVPDLAFSFCPEPPTRDVEEWLVRKGIDLNRPLLGITMVNWAAQNSKFSPENQLRYEVAIGAAAKWFAENIGGQVILFPQVWGPLESQDDRIPARILKGRLQSLGDSVVVIEDVLSPERLKAAYGVMDLFIATRLHSAIFAWTQAVPVIAISYQPKTLGVARMLGMEEWVIDIGETTPDALLDRLHKLWDERKQIRKSLQKRVSYVAEQSRQAAALVAEDWQDLVRSGQKSTSPRRF